MKNTKHENACAKHVTKKRPGNPQILLMRYGGRLTRDNPRRPGPGQSQARLGSPDQARQAAACQAGQPQPAKPLGQPEVILPLVARPQTRHFWESVPFYSRRPGEDQPASQGQARPGRAGQASPRPGRAQTRQDQHISGDAQASTRA